MSPGNRNGADQSLVSVTGESVTWIMKRVDPYMSIICPGSTTPTDTASEAASVAPTITGVPTAKPVSFAASSVT